jgi:repressor LexA
MTNRKDTGSAALGQYLAAKRLSGGLSYRELAARIGKAPSTVQAWEQGKRMPGLDDLFVLANVFDADLDELITLAATPLKDLERRLAAAEERYNKARRQASRPHGAADPERALTETRREMAFLENLIAQRKKRERLTKPPLRMASPYDFKKVPAFGAIRAGQPRLAVEEVAEYADVPRDADVDYSLTVDGDSMVGAGIAPGDVVWVKQADFADPGDTVVALLEDGEVTVKHLIRENGRYLLRANNADRDYPDMALGPGDRIIGVVQRIIKRPGPPPKVPD